MFPFHCPHIVFNLIYEIRLPSPSLPVVFFAFFPLLIRTNRNNDSNFLDTEQGKRNKNYLVLCVRRMNKANNGEEASKSTDI